jgi:RNA polymerase-interacting CarD/CdnL/TRCF family regulator
MPGYDLDKIGISSRHDGEVLHVYADRDNPIGVRNVYLVRETGVLVSMVDGDPVADEMTATVFRPVSAEEANWLMAALYHAKSQPEQSFDARQVYRKAQKATFAVRWAGPLPTFKPATLSEAEATEMVRAFNKEV